MARRKKAKREDSIGQKLHEAVWEVADELSKKWDFRDMCSAGTILLSDLNDTEQAEVRHRLAIMIREKDEGRPGSDVAYYREILKTAVMPTVERMRRRNELRGQIKQTPVLTETGREWLLTVLDALNSTGKSRRNHQAGNQ